MDHKLTFWCVSYYLVAFGTVGLNYCKSSCHEVASEFFATNIPDTPHWTLKLCFGAFHTIWVHSGPFGCLTKLGGKHAELVQNFVPRSRVGIFRIEGARSTPLDPKLMFRCISYYLCAFGTVCLPYETRCKTGRTSAKVRATKLRRKFFAMNEPDPPRRTLN